MVTRKFNKKYKFEALLPFEVKKSISLKNVNLNISLVDYLLFYIELIHIADQNN